MRRTPLSIVHLVRDPLPPLRADLLTLFGSELPRHGIGSELVGQRGERAASACADGWGGGGLHAVGRFGSPLAPLATPFWDALGLWRAWRRAPIDCIQVRDKTASALVGRAAAALLGVPFIYWMSFPIVEGYEARRDAVRPRARRAAHALRARLSRAVLYRLVLPRADHIFVQSEAMAAWLAARGLARERMSAVPMGVDSALFERASVAPSQDARLDGRRVIVYLGRVARSRQSGFLLDLAEALRAQLPAILLVIAGDAPSRDEMDWMRAQVAERGLGGHVLLTGWLAQRAALGYAVRAEVGLSPIPRGVLFDVSSPTKLVEYLALGIPSVANDIPDQRLVIEQSGAGLCVPMEVGAFGAAVLALLGNPGLCAGFAARGPAWVRAHRSYGLLAQQVAEAYARLVPDAP